MIILSVDIGTSSLKAALIDHEGRLRAFHREGYAPSSNVDAWERAFAASLGNLCSQSPKDQIDAICVSGNGPTLVPVTKEGETLLPLYWHDGRVTPPDEAFPQGRAASFFLPRAAWLKKNEPESYARVRFFLSSHEWLAVKLGAEPFTALPPSYEP
jgi:xylulokinase